VRRLGKRERLLIIASGACFIAVEDVEATVLGLIDGNGLVRAKSQFYAFDAQTCGIAYLSSAVVARRLGADLRNTAWAVRSTYEGTYPILLTAIKTCLSLRETQAQTSGAPATCVLL
jgi:hypothetical protein